MPDGAGYDDDFVLWTRAQAGRLRAAAAVAGNAGIDWENVAEEIESLGKRDGRGVTTRLDRIYEHLLKLEFSPASQPRAGWIETVSRLRGDIDLILADSPSLAGTVAVWQAASHDRVERSVANTLKAFGEDEASAALCRLVGSSQAVSRVRDDDYIPDARATTSASA